MKRLLVMKRLLERDEHATDQPVKLNAGGTLLHFVIEQMSSLNMHRPDQYISKLCERRGSSRFVARGLAEKASRNSRIERPLQAD